MSDMPAPPILPRRRAGGAGMRRQAGDSGVIKTNDDAQATKLSCAAMGYFTDAILPLLHKAPPSRKPPIINRGTWARHAVFRQVTQDFITACAANHPGHDSSSPALQQADPAAAAAGCNHTHGSHGSSGSRWQQPVCQVVTLGAGTDSSWFSLQQQAWELLPAAHFIEMDFQEVVSKKARTLLSTPQLLHLLPDGTTAATAPVPGTTSHPAAAPAAASGAGQQGAMPPPQPQPPQQPPQQQARQQRTPPAAAQLPPGGTGGLFSLSRLVPQQPQHSSSSSSHAPMTWTKQTNPAAAAAAAATGGQPDSSGASTIAGQQQRQVEPQQHCSSSAVAGASQPIQQQQQQPSNCSIPGSPGHTTTSSSSSPHTSSGPQPPAAVVQHVQELRGRQYSLVAADLRSLEQFRAALARAGFRPHVPTLYLCECVLIYLEPREAQAVLAAAAAAAAAEAGAPAAVAIYEQTRPDDAFGATMIANLQARGCPLRSVMAVPTPASQAQRLTAAGWTAVAAADMAAVYYAGSSNTSSRGNCRLLAADSAAGAAGGAAAGAGAGSAGAAEAAESGWLRPCWQSERRRIEGLELLDELEEWKLLQEHYCLALGVLGDGAASGWLADALRLQQLAALNK